MPRQIVLSATLLALAAASIVTSAHAADLPTQSRLGAVFAEPRARVYVYQRKEEPATDVISIIVPPPVPGYYGQRDSFDYHSYYGTSPWKIFNRLPYACEFYGYC